MKEIRHIVETYGKIDFSKNRAALAMVARVEGSSYRRTGARMLVLDNGTYLGGISGGCLEGDALRRAQKAIAANRPSLVTYDTTRDDHDQIGVGLGCNGVVDVLFTPLDPADAANPVALLGKFTHSRQPRLLATVTDCESRPDALGKSFPFENDEQWQRDFPFPELSEAVLNDALRCLKNGETRTLFYQTASGGEMRICLEVLMPATHLVIFGGNNDIHPMARIGKELGWDLTVMANPLKVEKSLFALGAKVLHPKGDEKPSVDPYTALVLMAHDYKTDFQNLQNSLETEARYIGLLGPRKRFQKMLDTLEAEGKPISDENKERIFAPAGLDIGALTPEEIALAIAAEIRACFAGRPGTSLRSKAGAIHEQA
jgi:xanthine/CO dehydrogenase XdhC/CoxF family maturation factor